MEFGIKTLDLKYGVETRGLPAKKVFYTPISLPHDKMRDFKQHIINLGIHAFATGAEKSNTTFILFVGDSPDAVDLEICIEVDEFPEGGPSIERDEIDSLLPNFQAPVLQREVNQTEQKYAICYYKGSRDMMPNVYMQFKEWFTSQGHQLVAAPMVEVYWNNIHTSPEAELLTELWWPIS